MIHVAEYTEARNPKGFQWGWKSPKIAHYHWGSGPPSITWLHRPTARHTPNDISIEPAVSSRLTLHYPYTLLWDGPFPTPKLPLPVGDQKKKEEISHRQQGPLRGSSSPYGALSQRGLLHPIKLAYDQRRPDGRLKLTASAFNRLDQYAGSPGHRTYCYTCLLYTSPSPRDS